MNGQLVLIIPVGDSNLPGFGGGIAAGGGHPSHGLPGYGHPDQGLPGGAGHPSQRPPNVPPNVTWPPQISPGHPSGQPLPPEISSGRPVQPIQLPPGSPMPADTAFVAVYSEKSGWVFSVVHLAQPK